MFRHPVLPSSLFIAINGNQIIQHHYTYTTTLYTLLFSYQYLHINQILDQKQELLVLGIIVAQTILPFVNSTLYRQVLATSVSTQLCHR